MRLINSYLAKTCLILLAFSAAQVMAKEYVVANKKDYNKLAGSLVAGDTVILKNGIWTDFEILFEGQGKKDAPITLTAQTKGKVILSGNSNLRLAGKHLVASGFVFSNGYTPSSAVIEFRRDAKALAYHSRVSEMVIDNYNNPNKRESDYWVALYGQHNRFDHNHLVGKRNTGVTLAVRLNTEDSQENYHKIDHNYFGYRPTFGSNGGETLRIGTSHYSLTDSYTLVENNYFDKTNGEVEIISVKSGKNTLRGNVFFEARGTLTLRHGNGNIIEENIFFGNQVEHTGGIRVINKDQVVRNNYLEGLTGYRFGSGLTVMNGVPNSPIHRYHQVDNATITNNTLIDVNHVHLAAGSDAERSAAPVNSVMRNNLIVNNDKQQAFTIFDDVSGIKLTQNITNTDVLKDLAYGFEKKELTLTRQNNGLLYPESKKIDAGVKRDLPVLTKDATGVSWYPKTPALVEFDSGKTRAVDANANALLAAVNDAEPGDTLRLAPGEFDIPKLLIIDKTLTLKAQKAGETQLTFERSALFEIHNGGSLKIEGLTISGKNSPDSAGNSVIRTQGCGMLENYRFAMINSTVTDLNINRAFHFFASGKGAFADEITLTNNTFNTVSGDILSLDTETDDLGIYNAEYVTLEGNTFTNIEGAVVKLYRGGTDESTFGPHLLMTKNKINNVGLGKRNRAEASVYLHGVQVSDLSSNEWANSAPLKVEHTVGEPITTIVNNTFQTTSSPTVVELHARGQHTARIKNNKTKK